MNRDTPVVIIEAMKMEATTRAPRAGIVDRNLVSAGQTVRTGEPLVALGA